MAVKACGKLRGQGRQVGNGGVVLHLGNVSHSGDDDANPNLVQGIAEGNPGQGPFRPKVKLGDVRFDGLHPGQSPGEPIPLEKGRPKISRGELVLRCVFSRKGTLIQGDPDDDSRLLPSRIGQNLRRGLLVKKIKDHLHHIDQSNTHGPDHRVLILFRGTNADHADLALFFEFGQNL